MLVIVFLLQMGMLATLKWFALPYYEYVVVPLINSLMLFIIIQRFGFHYTLVRLMCGEILPLYMYLAWAFVFPQP